MPRSTLATHKVMPSDKPHNRSIRLSCALSYQLPDPPSAGSTNSMFWSKPSAT